MATSTWTTVIDHTTDAAFRTWGSELNTKLAAIGLVQTADTGQINWNTVNRAGSSIDAGYEIWRFDDYLQATAPIYLKILYGSNSNASNARISIQVGSGTNSSGTLTGQNTVPHYSGYPSSTTYMYTGQQVYTPRPSYMCYNSTSGFFGLMHKYAGYCSTYGSFFIYVARTCDTTGAPTANGATVAVFAGTVARYTALKFTSTSSNTTTTATQSWGGCTIPYKDAYSSTTVTPLTSSKPRAFINWSAIPDIQPMISVCTVNNNEFPVWTTFNTTLFGSTAHTYLSLPHYNYGYHGAVPAETTADGSNWVLGMLWE